MAQAMPSFVDFKHSSNLDEDVAANGAEAPQRPVSDLSP
jgi:hypothetical protein